MTTLPTLRPIPNAEERRKAVEVCNQLIDLYDEKSTIRELIRQEHIAALAPIYERHRQEMAEAEALFQARMDEAATAIEKKIAEVEDLEQSLTFVIGKGERAMTDDYDPLTCALTGLAVFEDDDYMRDELSGNIILRDALPWPDDTAITDEEAA
jgi:hypothetical protein